MNAGSIMERLSAFVKRVFKTSLEVFLEALRYSPNAQGYVAGSITELLLKRHLDSLGYETLRIREKWEGKKQHHGDFYFRKRDSESGWYIVEAKGVKSNSEKWHKLYNRDKLISLLYTHADKIRWLDHEKKKEEAIEIWIKRELPEFYGRYSEPLYDYEEVKNYTPPRNQRETPKSRAIQNLKRLSREEINERIEERIQYLNSKLRVLETHFVASAGSGGREIATPRKDEFHIVAVDIFLKYYKHYFLFANPRNLEGAEGYPDHLQQNYVIGFVFVENGVENLHCSEDWKPNFEDIATTLSGADAVKESEMQVDYRYMKEADNDAD
ncbi:MAG: hypothetical protein KatS3mg019_1606 [Fimbriimonadales bacterium]|nr:MAG: hypothetical protein KatS3mg019_1606 [Fimbriimonadales bacterium]